jgi:8-oxo-dGTP diphosphatase
VLEETGLRCTLERELASTHYVDGKQRPKVVRYWLMHVIDGAFTPNREVDEVVWLSPTVAEDWLTYHHDRDVLAAALGTR